MTIDYMLSPMSPPGESLNLGVVLGNPNTESFKVFIGYKTSNQDGHVV